MDPEKSLERAASELAAAIRNALGMFPEWPSDTWRELEAGRLPAGIAAAACSFAAARARASAAPGPRVTAVSASWARSAASYAKANGRLPSVRELAVSHGRSRKAAEYAIGRLKRLGIWPDQILASESVSADTQK